MENFTLQDISGRNSLPLQPTFGKVNTDMMYSDSHCTQEVTTQQILNLILENQKIQAQTLKYFYGIVSKVFLWDEKMPDINIKAPPWL